MKLLFEKSLSTGQLPSSWKYSTITAIYKKELSLKQGITDP